MTAACTCYDQPWFHGEKDSAVTITVQCPQHGQGPQAIGPTRYEEESDKAEE
jgi:hypothetical protein